VRADPKIGKLLNDRVSLFRKQADAAFSQPEKAAQIAKALQKKMAGLQSALRQLLVAAGFPEDYLQPVYRCALCRDTGSVGDPLRERCACFYESLRRQLAMETDDGLSPWETFEAYDETVYVDSPLEKDPDAPLQEKRSVDSQRRYTARLRDICFEYANGFPDNPRKNLLFLGKSGLGKTYLMNCVGNAVKQKGAFAIKLTAYQLTERMRAMVFAHMPEAMTLLMEAPLLLLDDLGAEPMIPNITIEMLFALLNERELRGLHTVISSNLHADELKARYTERVTSRLYDRRTTATLVFRGQDVRLRKL
jgi:DNA replication protein DnaC